MRTLSLAPKLLPVLRTILPEGDGRDGLLKAVTAIAAAAVLALGLGLWGNASAEAPGPARVLIIGGSAAYGWRDKTGQGYIERGLKAWSAFPDGLDFQNEAIPGATVNNPKVANRYAQWLSPAPPAIVVLGWGILDDMRAGTPWAIVLAEVRNQTLEALSAGAVVFFVTPPATKPTYTIYQGSENALVGALVRSEEAIGSPDLYVFNVLGAEERWLHAHHQTYAPYMSNFWDPNTAGHILAGGLLANAIKAVLPQGTVSYTLNGRVAPQTTYFTTPAPSTVVPAPTR